MRKRRSSILKGVVFTIALALFLPVMLNAGSLEPPGPPAPTMKTLDQTPPAWSQKLPASERFVLVMGDVAVLDKETGLVWQRDTDSTLRDWYVAQSYCYLFSLGGRKGWRLPVIEELASLVDPSQSNPALPAGHPFTNVKSNYYWSSTTYAYDPGDAWVVGFGSGTVYYGNKSNDSSVRCVRAGQ